MMARRWIARALVGAMLLGAFACSGDDTSKADGGADAAADVGNTGDGGDGGGGGGDADASGAFSQNISAAAGGTVDPGNGIVIEIPAGALASDTTITVAELSKSGLPDEANIASRVYDLGPDGTQFSAPVTLTIDFQGTAPTNATPMIAKLEGGAWKPLSDSAVNGSAVKATTTSFSVYAVLWIIADPRLAGTLCPSGKFSGCGGDISGATSMARCWSSMTRTVPA